MTAQYGAALAPHPWYAIGPAPKLAGAYPDNDPAKVSARMFFVTFSYDATIEVLDADGLTDDEIEEALREAHAEDIEDNARLHDDDIDVTPTSATTPDYTVRIVDGRAEVV